MKPCTFAGWLLDVTSKNKNAKLTPEEKKQTERYTYVALISFFLGLSVADYTDNNRWESFIYADKLDLTNHVPFGEYSTLERCREASLRLMSQVGWSKTGDYECAKNCKDDGTLPKVCETTSR